MFARHKLLFPLAALLLMALLPHPAFAGPGWMALEHPANPHDPATRGALATLRSYHHGVSMAFTVRGMLEGRVAGRHVTRDVDVVPLDEPGLYAVRGEVPAQGAWVLRITLFGEGGATVGSILAALAPDGSIGRVQVPFDRSRDGWSVPREARPDEVASMLAWSQAMGAVVNSELEAALPSQSSGGALWALLLFPLGLAAGRKAGMFRP